MNATLKRFEDLATQARAGDRDAERTFFAEAARLFPSDFGEGHPSESVDRHEGTDRFDDALAIIRQATMTGG